MSSSSAGQWMPIPGPIRSQRRRSLGVPSARRGYQLMGTETVRPSRNSTIRVSAVILTFFAVAVSAARLEVLMPCLYEFCLVLLRQRGDRVQFCWRESVVVFQSKWTQPELGCLPVAFDVNVNGFASIAREEKEPVRTALQNRRTHNMNCARFLPTRQVPPIRLTASAHRRPPTRQRPTAFSYSCFFYGREQWVEVISWPGSSRLSRFGTHSSRSRRMSHELLHVFKHAERQRLVHRRKVVEEFRERSAMFQVVEQRPNRHTCAHEDGRPPRMSGSECTPGSCRPWLNLFDSALPSIRRHHRMGVWCGLRQVSA